MKTLKQILKEAYYVDPKVKNLIRPFEPEIKRIAKKLKDYHYEVQDQVRELGYFLHGDINLGDSLRLIINHWKSIERYSPATSDKDMRDRLEYRALHLVEWVTKIINKTYQNPGHEDQPWRHEPIKKMGEELLKDLKKLYDNITILIDKALTMSGERGTGL